MAQSPRGTSPIPSSSVRWDRHPIVHRSPRPRRARRGSAADSGSTAADAHCRRTRGAAPPTLPTSSSVSSSADRHIENPDAINVLDSTMYDHVCSTFDDEDYKLSLEESYGRSGVMVLVVFTHQLIVMQSDATSLTFGANLLADFETIYKDGIPWTCASHVGWCIALPHSCRHVFRGGRQWPSPGYP